MDTDTHIPDPSPWFPESDPTRLKVLGKLIEEVTELATAAARCIIQGIDEAEPVTGKINRVWLEDECADAQANIELTIATFKLDRVRIANRRNKKFTYLSRWLAGLTRPAT